LGDIPKFHPMRPVLRAAIIIGGLLIWVVLFLVITAIINLLGYDVSRSSYVIIYLGINILFSLLIFSIFNRWVNDKYAYEAARQKFGSARFSNPQERQQFTKKNGIYIGNIGYQFSDRGHIFTCAGTRGGKGTNLIIPNLLGLGNYEGSWVVIDPKGENAAITARYQRERGQDVVLLNPWGLLSEYSGQVRSFNPLDILDITSPDLVDDIQMIAEMIVPVDRDGNSRFFSDNARTIVAAMLLHIMVNMDKEFQHLGTLYKIMRYSKEETVEILAEMRKTRNIQHQELLDGAAQEVLKLMQSGDNAYGSILATALQCTNFLKSPSLQKSLQSDYVPSTLSDGKSTIYVIIPADKLQSHARWLRLVVTTTMRAVIRKPNKRVTFLLDEFAALGYLPEIETALSTYAGYNVTVWPILQSLIQLKSIYGDNWETFIANAAIRHFFSVNDNFSADYVSSALGTTTYVQKIGSWFVGTHYDTSVRLLVTPDEVRRFSQDSIFAFLGNTPPSIFGKHPYYQIPEIVTRADDNPYMN
jgi:type IV secretion system protein VirD4